MTALKLATPPFAPPQAKAVIDKLLADGCRCGSSTEARLVRRPVGAAGTQQQIVLQCLSCGDAIGSPQAHGLHPNWQDYPLFDKALKRSRYNDEGEQVAAEASRNLGFEVLACGEVFLIEDPLHMLAMTGAEIGLAEAMRQFGATRAWRLRERSRPIGLVCEGEPVEVEGAEIRRLASGYLALIERVAIFKFMMEAVRVAARAAAV
jgi:hypothetical protein